LPRQSRSAQSGEHLDVDRAGVVLGLEVPDAVQVTAPRGEQAAVGQIRIDPARGK
jgi:hypothetical protein